MSALLPNAVFKLILAFMTAYDPKQIFLIVLLYEVLFFTIGQVP